MKKNSETISIGELINSTIFGDIVKEDKMNFVIKQTTIFSFWEDIVGKKFVKYTKPYVIKGGKIFVSVKSPVIIQELNLYKAKLLKKINSYSIPLNIEIKNIVFDYKNYEEKTRKTNDNYVEDKPVFITKQDLNDVNIDKNLELDIAKNIDKISFLDAEQKEKFVKKILSTYQAKKLQK